VLDVRPKTWVVGGEIEQRTAQTLDYGFIRHATSLG